MSSKIFIEHKVGSSWGEDLKNFREESFLSIEEAAEKLDINPDTLRVWEAEFSGKNRFDLSLFYLAKMANVYGVPLACLVGWLDYVTGMCDKTYGDYERIFGQNDTDNRWQTD